MIFDIPYLRNLTTGILHTTMKDVYTGIEQITGTGGLMTHQLPGAREAMLPFLRENLPPRFFNNTWDKEHVGTIEMPVMNDHETAIFWRAFKPESDVMMEKILSKNVIVVDIDASSNKTTEADI